MIIIFRIHKSEKVWVHSSGLYIIILRLQVPHSIYFGERLGPRILPRFSFELFCCKSIWSNAIVWNWSGEIFRWMCWLFRSICHHVHVHHYVRAHLSKSRYFSINTLSWLVYKFILILMNIISLLRCTLLTLYMIHFFHIHKRMI